MDILTENEDNSQYQGKLLKKMTVYINCKKITVHIKSINYGDNGKEKLPPIINLNSREPINSWQRELGDWIIRTLNFFGDFFKKN